MIATPGVRDECQVNFAVSVKRILSGHAPAPAPVPAGVVHALRLKLGQSRRVIGNCGLDTQGLYVVIYLTHALAPPPTATRPQSGRPPRRRHAEPARRPRHRSPVCGARLFRCARPGPSQIRNAPAGDGRGPGCRADRRGISLLAPVVLSGPARVPATRIGGAAAGEAGAPGRSQTDRADRRLSGSGACRRRVPAPGRPGPTRRAAIRDPRASAQHRARARAAGKKTTAIRVTPALDADAVPTA